MKKIIFVLISVVSLSFCANAQILDMFKKNNTGSTGATNQSNTGSLNSGSGNQTIVNVENQDTGPNSSLSDINSGYREATWNVTFSAFPLVMIDQAADQQFLTNPGDASDIGFSYDEMPKISIAIRYVTMRIPGKTMEYETEKIVYDENGDPKYDENGVVETETDTESYDTMWVHKHILWMIGYKQNFGNENQYRMQVSLGSAFMTEVEEEESGTELNKLGTPIVLDIKFSKRENDFEYGLQYTRLQLSSDEKNMNDYMNGGYTWFGLFIKAGLTFLN